MAFESLKDFFTRNKGKDDRKERPVEHLVVIFNLVNHASFLAATLLTLAMREMTSIRITFADIRDVIPSEADQYLWVDVGSEKDFRRYCQNNSSRDWYDAIINRAFFLTPPNQTDKVPMETAIGLVYQFLEVAIGNDVGKNRHLFIDYANMSEAFLTPELSVEACYVYYEALNIAYRHYCQDAVKLDDFVIVPSVGDIEAFKDHQKEICLGITTKCREITIGDKNRYYLTALSPDIWNIIRRLYLSRKSFMHISLGSYGPIVYSPMPLPIDLEKEKGLTGGLPYLIAPDTDPIKKQL